MTNSGDLDGAFAYLYNGNQIIEVRNGADDVELLIVHGMRYIDEIVCQRVKDRGWAYVHQDANWNVTALTAMNGAVIERYWYKPYGEFAASAEYGWFDYDQDGDVDSSDAAVVGMGGACLSSTSQACQTMDADGDRDLDANDYDIISACAATLTTDTKLQRVPAAPSSRRGNLFAHQGLLFDREIASYQNRARQYDPTMRRFVQWDPQARRFERCSAYHDGLSPYASCICNPVRHVDPTGNYSLRVDGIDASSSGNGSNCFGADLSYANRVFSQCHCAINLVYNFGVSLDLPTITAALGANGLLDLIPPTGEAGTLQGHAGGGDVVIVYVDGITLGPLTPRGYNFGGILGLANGWNTPPSGLAIDASGGCIGRTVAHELGHTLLGGVHTTDPNNLMTPGPAGGTGTQLTQEQCKAACCKFSKIAS